jgi:hypothetical protein
MTLNDNTVTYTGEDALGFYSAALLTGQTIGIIKNFPNVKSKLKIASLDLSNILQDSDCTFTSGGTIDLAQKTLEVETVKINLELCKRTFEGLYLSAQMRPGSDAEIPASFNTYLLGEIAKNTSASVESLIWAGTTSSVIEGFVSRFTADSDVIGVTGSSITQANVIAEVAKVYNAIPDAIFNKGNVVIFVSNKIAKLYKQAVAAASAEAYMIGDRPLNYLGLDLIAVNGIPADNMVAAEPENLWFGTDLVSDMEDVKIIDQSNTSGAPTVRMVAEFKIGVNYGVSTEIVFRKNA